MRKGRVGGRRLPWRVIGEDLSNMGKAWLGMINRCSGRMLLRPPSFTLLNWLYLIYLLLHLIIPLSLGKPGTVRFELDSEDPEVIMS